MATGTAILIHIPKKIRNFLNILYCNGISVNNPYALYAPINKEAIYKYS